MRPDSPLFIKGFADAVASAVGIADRVTCGHGVAVTDQRGLVLDMLLFTGEEHTAEDAIEAGLHVPAYHPRARGCCSSRCWTTWT